MHVLGQPVERPVSIRFRNGLDGPDALHLVLGPQRLFGRVPPLQLEFVQPPKHGGWFDGQFQSLGELLHPSVDVFEGPAGCLQLPRIGPFARYQVMGESIAISV